MSGTGTTCTFSQGGSSIAIFCENGCCATDCCKKPTVDDDSLAIALAVIIGFLLLLALIAILMYFCLRRKKTKKGVPKEKKNRNRNGVVPLSTISGSSSVVHNVNKLVQTEDPNPKDKDRILWGKAQRWSSKPTSKSRSPPRKNPWFGSKKRSEKSTQTVAGDSAPVKHAVPQDRRTSIAQSPFLEDVTQTTEKGVQTPAPKSTMVRSKTRPILPSDLAGKKEPKKPWRPSMQHKSLTTMGPSGLDTELNYTTATELLDPGYSIHRCIPEYVYDSDLSRSQSIAPDTARTANSEL